MNPVSIRTQNGPTIGISPSRTRSPGMAQIVIAFDLQGNRHPEVQESEHQAHDIEGGQDTDHIVHGRFLGIGHLVDEETDNEKIAEHEKEEQEIGEHSIEDRAEPEFLSIDAALKPEQRVHAQVAYVLRLAAFLLMLFLFHFGEGAAGRVGVGQLVIFACCFLSLTPDLVNIHIGKPGVMYHVIAQRVRSARNRFRKQLALRARRSRRILRRGIGWLRCNRGGPHHKDMLATRAFDTLAL